MSLAPGRTGTLSLYRALLRVAKNMPTEERRVLLTKRTRQEFRRNKDLVDPAEVQEALALGEVQLENFSRIQKHLSTIQRQPSIIPVALPERTRQQEWVSDEDRAAARDALRQSARLHLATIGGKELSK
ncbi:hypothetical protein BC828DRAFT_389935 [Blastocladiella britannica]|nr:hypothetical protein BC828DRAFT_389935 [Blastocladiella britannica]